MNLIPRLIASSANVNDRDAHETKNHCNAEVAEGVRNDFGACHGSHDVEGSED